MLPAKDISLFCIRGEGKTGRQTGYLRKSRFNHVYYAHRLAYSDFYGGIPVGYHIHHLCGNKLCINPEHLVALTPAEHREIHVVPESIKRMEALTRCPSGHELDGSNERQRFCKTCKNARNRAWRIKNPDYAKRYWKNYKRGVTV